MFFGKRKILLFLAFGFAAGLGCSSKKDSSPMLAKVNGEIITVAEFEEALRREQWKFDGEASSPNGENPGIKNKVIETLIKTRLLLQAAKKEDIQVSKEMVEKSLKDFSGHYPKEEDFERILQASGTTLEDFKKQRGQDLMIRLLIDKIASLDETVVNQDLLKDYYKGHKEEFWHPEQVRARQIVTDSEEKATAIREILINGAPFEEVANKYSLSPDRKQGGDLGWFGRGVMPKEFENICFSLKEGLLSPVIQTPYGYHLFEVVEKRGSGHFPFDAIEGKLRKKILEREGRKKFEKWYEELRGSSQIEVSAPLLQGD